MDVRHLRLLVAVADEGSIRSAARATYTSQPQVSRIIRRLERDLGVELLVRAPGGALLTPPGEVLVQQAREIFDQLDRTVSRVRGIAAEKEPLRVGLVAGRMAAGELTEPILSAFHAAHRDIPLIITELDFSDHRRALLDRRIDLAIVRLPVEEADLKLTPLFSEPRVLCSQRSGPLAGATEFLVNDVLDETMIGLENAATLWSDFWSLDDVRGEPGRVEKTGATTVEEMRFSLVFGRASSTVAASTWRMGFQHPELVATPLTGASPSSVAVASRISDDRDVFHDFCSVANTVCHDFVDLVPGAELASA